MGAHTYIEWCDHTFNPWEGCTKVSPGCAHCYAENRNARFGGGTAPNWGKGAPRRRTSPANWLGPIKWNRDFADAHDEYMVSRQMESVAILEPVRPRVFCASLADLLDPEVDPMWLADLLNLIHATPHLDWLLLTKRPELWRSRMEAVCEVDGDNHIAWNWLKPSPNIPANVWMGTSVENQEVADVRIPALLKIPARVRFLSCEPLLENVDLLIDGECSSWACRECNSRNVDTEVEVGPGDISTYKCNACGYMGAGEDAAWKSDIHWVICGGESGSKARPMHPEWARSLRDQCAAAGVPFLFKQWGEWAPGVVSDGKVSITVAGVCKNSPEWHEWADGNMSAKIGKKAAGRLLDGLEHNAFPGVQS